MELPVPRRNIIDALDNFTSEILHQLKSKEAITNLLHTELNNAGFDVSVGFSMSTKVPVGDMNMNAYYDRVADSTGDVAVSIDLIFSEDTRDVEFDTKGVGNFTARLADAIVHEMIHRTQHRNRNFLKGRRCKTVSDDPQLKAAQEYLGRPDEIEAYSHNIASELLRVMDIDIALEFMRRFGKAIYARDERGDLLSPNLYGIMTTFEFDTSNPVIKKLATGVVKYLNILEKE